MVKHCLVAVSLLLGVSACDKKEQPTAAEVEAARRAKVDEDTARAAKERAEVAVEQAKQREERAEDRLDKAEDRAEEAADRADIDWKGPDEGWADDWAEFADGRDHTVEKGDYVIERDADGSITAWRKVKQVAGESFADLKDAALAAEVKSKLAADEDTRATKINVDVDDHIVSLRGSVQNRHEAAEAVRLALSCPGTEKVVSHMKWAKK
jgi:hypothetical protein